MNKRQYKRTSKKQQELIPEQKFQELSEDNKSQDQGIQSKQENSLAMITKKFIQLIKRSENATIDLNFAADVLNVQKRRLYDITNVLEGINYIQKTQKSKMTWIGGKQHPQIQMIIDTFQKRLKYLKQEQEKLDKTITDLNKLIRSQVQNQQMQKYHCITQNDIMKIYKAMSKGDASKQLMILSAPRGATIEVGEEVNGSFLKLDSGGKGKINVFSCNANGIKEFGLQKKAR